MYSIDILTNLMMSRALIPRSLKNLIKVEITF